MKNLKFFKTRSEYKNFILKNIVTQKEFLRHPFYKGLINFIIDNRTPIFFEASEECEYAHFSQFFNFTLMRSGYENRYLQDMYYIHDFVHMIFDNPLELKEQTLELFSQIAIFNEYTAANDTEILTYYRLPKLRPKTLPFPILYDFLKEVYETTPDATTLFLLRKSIIEDNNNAFWQNNSKIQDVFKFLRKFKENNKVWCKVWYQNFPKLNISYADKRVSFPINNYESFISEYKENTHEQNYQKNILFNTRVGLEMIGEKNLPENFSDCKTALLKLENKIIMKDAAVEFSKQYKKRTD